MKKLSSSRVSLATAAGLSAAVLLSVACSSSSGHPANAIGGGTIGGGSGGGGEGGTPATDGGASATDSGHCLSGAFDVDVDTGLGGTNEIAGTVQFAGMGVAAGHTIVLTITNTMNQSVTYADSFSFMTQKESFTFRLRTLPDATYVLQAQADIVGTASASDPGDLDGYFGGTTVTPIHTRADSTPITVPACRSATEFGIGPK